MNLDQWVDDLFEAQTTFLSSLVATKSTRGLEETAQKMMHEAMQKDAQQVDVLPIELNNISHLRGFSPATVSYDGMFNRIGHYGNQTGKGRSLIFNGHIDVVPEGPLAGWSVDPYGGEVKQGKLYGRGSSDMKAGLVASLYALRAIHAAGMQPDAPVYLQSVVEEECTGNGALACLAAGYQADAVIIGEPFNEVLVTEQLGVIWFQIKLKGLPVHAEQATAGVNAIEAMLPVIAAYRQLEEKWNAQKHSHAAYAEHSHPINLNVAQFNAGDWTSSVPSWAVLNLRIAMYPGDDLSARQTEIAAVLQQLEKDNDLVGRAQPELSYHGFLAEGYRLPRHTDAEKVLAAAHQLVFNDSLKKGPITATTDARFYGLYQQTPTLVYGPKGQGYHGFDEYVELASLRNITKVYARFIENWCGLTPRSQ